jgi:hypothetical protein
MQGDRDVFAKHHPQKDILYGRKQIYFELCAVSKRIPDVESKSRTYLFSVTNLESRKRGEFAPPSCFSEHGAEFEGGTNVYFQE